MCAQESRALKRDYSREQREDLVRREKGRLTRVVAVQLRLDLLELLRRNLRGVDDPR